MTRALHALVNSSTNSQTGGKKPSNFLRRGISLALIALLTTGCSKAVEIPRTDYDAASQDPKARFRVEMIDGTIHEATHYSLTDSTIVVEKVHKASDFRYRADKTTVVAARAGIASISKYETAHGRSFVALSTAFLVILFFATFEGIPSS